MRNYIFGSPTSQGWQLKVVHLGVRHNQGKLLILDVELEQRPTADDLEGGQDDLGNVDVADQDVAGDLPDVAEEAQVQVLVLKPGQLQVAVDVGAVGVPVPEVAVVVVAVVDRGEAAVRADANWKGHIK